jgi:predicted acylesterase/phospholipase RssA
MRKLNPRGLVIAVDVGPATEARTRARHGDSLSGWTALWSTVRKKGHVPPLALTVLSSMLVAANRDRDSVVADNVSDVYLDLDVNKCDPFDFDAVEQTAHAGYQAARPRLETWLASVGAHGEAR